VKIHNLLSFQKLSPMQVRMAWLSRYSILAILIGLCVAFSMATLTKQQPNANDAAEQILRALRAGPSQGILVVSSDSRDDREFGDAFRQKWGAIEKNDPSRTVSYAAGTPQDVRKAIDGSSDERLTLVLSPDTRNWKLFEGVAQKFPKKELRLVASEPVLWPNFLKYQNLINVVNQIVIIAILAIGMTLVILTGGIDLSVGSLIALSAVICTRAVQDWGGGEQASATSIFVCGFLALLVCGIAGLINGLLIVRCQLPPFIATLGTMLIASGCAFILSGGQSIATVPDSFVWLGRGTWLGLPVAVLFMVGMYAITHVVMRSTVYGRAIYAIGGNAEAARLCGLPVRSLIASTYVISGLLAGLGGLVMASRLKSGDAKYGAMYELYVIAAVVVGGTSLRGGYGSVLGTLVGALIIAVVENGMNLVHVESYTQKVVFGFVILGAVLLDRQSRSPTA
jgi:ribose transport system permease protein